jgi:hypothetical protein
MVGAQGVMPLQKSATGGGGPLAPYPDLPPVMDEVAALLHDLFPPAPLLSPTCSVAIHGVVVFIEDGHSKRRTQKAVAVGVCPRQA